MSNFDIADDSVRGNLEALTVDEVAALLIEARRPEDVLEDYWYGSDAWAEWNEGTDGPEEVEGLGLVEVVEHEGGEGEGDHAHIVFRVANEAGDVVRHFKVDGYYSSYGGFDWDGDLYEATPEEKVITVYTRV